MINIKLGNLSIFKFLKITADDIRGAKTTLFNLVSLSITFGQTNGSHIHVTLGLSKWEIFVGFSIWNKYAV